jgi:hypothetical protein
MTKEPAPENPPACDPSAPGDTVDTAIASSDAGQLSEFSQRLASFGLGESPDPLLTQARRPAKRQSRN